VEEDILKETGESWRDFGVMILTLNFFVYLVWFIFCGIGDEIQSLAQNQASDPPLAPLCDLFI
jgi:hypothetical protein